MKTTLQSRATGIALLLALLATQGSYACYNEPPVAYIETVAALQSNVSPSGL